jgi:DNA-binding protein Fis
LEHQNETYATRALEHCRGNKTRAAKLLGMTRLTLRTKVVAYGWAEFLEQAEGEAG